VQNLQQLIRQGFRAVPALPLFFLIILAGCATAPAVGRGGLIYRVRVASMNGIPTTDHGPNSRPACTLQVGDRVVRVWLARSSESDQQSPVVLEADAEALKRGILLERSWQEAIVHEVSDVELLAGVAVVYLPGAGRPMLVELQFDPVQNPRAGSEPAAMGSDGKAVSARRGVANR
jgi:hypothetical protein